MAPPGGTHGCPKKERQDLWGTLCSPGTVGQKNKDQFKRCRRKETSEKKQPLKKAKRCLVHPAEGESFIQGPGMSQSAGKKKKIKNVKNTTYFKKKKGIEIKGNVKNKRKFTTAGKGSYVGCLQSRCEKSIRR